MSAPVGIGLDNWLSAPYAKWSFQHVEDFAEHDFADPGGVGIRPVAHLGLGRDDLEAGRGPIGGGAHQPFDRLFGQVGPRQRARRDQGGNVGQTKGSSG